MIDLLPFKKNTIVSGARAEEILAKLRLIVRPPEIPRTYTIKNELTVLRRYSNENYPFEGKIKDFEFQITPYSNYPEHFLPLIIGKIEPTSRGCILFLTYRLNNGTLFLWGLSVAIFWFILAIYIFILANWLTVSLLLLFFIGAYAVFILNFRQKVKLTRNLFERLIN
jgi:hypothetical protein